MGTIKVDNNTPPPPPSGQPPSNTNPYAKDKDYIATTKDLTYVVDNYKGNYQNLLSKFTAATSSTNPAVKAAYSDFIKNFPLSKLLLVLGLISVQDAKNDLAKYSAQLKTLGNVATGLNKELKNAQDAENKNKSSYSYSTSEDTYITVVETDANGKETTRQISVKAVMAELLDYKTSDGKPDISKFTSAKPSTAISDINAALNRANNQTQTISTQAQQARTDLNTLIEVVTQILLKEETGKKSINQYIGN